ncbi:MAG: anaerobic sulfatase maturase [Lentisphaerae bacterium]|nr:anaerobic sulfatase maturase [Lentisphaerota bacterium]
MPTCPSNAVCRHPAHVLIKPAGPDCNLRCKYCFYLEKHALFVEEKSCRMTDDVLEHYIRSYIASQPTQEIEFAWQGGEPTLMGLPFYRRAVALQKHYGAGRTINNSLQTNGTLLTDEWCAFLAEEKFLVGLSIDGPEEIHNRYRVFKDGRGAFAQVDRAAKLMRKHGVEYNALTCVTRESAYEGKQIYRFLRDYGFEFMQFIPIVEREPDERSRELGLALASPPPTDAPSEPSPMMPFAVEALQYGQFLVDIFEEWVRRDVGKVFVNHFDCALGAWYGGNPSLCIYAKVCGSSLAIEHDGSIYACDHFVYPEFNRGNIMREDMAGLLSSNRQQAFGMSKWLDLPSCCRHCDYLHACHGGCLKHRSATSPEGEPGLNYLCPGYKLFFKHVDPYMKQMVELLREGRPAADIVNFLPRRELHSKAQAKRKRKKGRRK